MGVGICSSFPFTQASTHGLHRQVSTRVISAQAKTASMCETLRQVPVQLGDVERGGGNAGMALLQLKEESEGCCPKDT